jgi:hypothetical protein
MEFQATKMILSEDPQMIKSLVKVKLQREKWKKVDGKWEVTGHDNYEMVAFDEVATALMMEAAGTVIDIEGKINTREYKGKNGSIYHNVNFVINKYEHTSDD